MDIHSLLAALSVRRPLFHSEADFQHEFAMLLRQNMPDWKVRLERPFGYDMGGATDIVLTHDGSVVGIELKYLTKRFVYETPDEIFQLKAQGATDLRRYDILKDIARLEAFNARHGGISYVVALTNDPAYWRPTSRQNTIDAAFRLCEGRLVSGQLNWMSHASAGSVKGRDKIVELKSEYRIAWRDYGLPLTGAMAFRYLAVEIS